MYILIKKKVASYRFNTRSLLRNSESTQASKEEDLNELTISRINSNIGTAIYEIAKYLNLLLWKLGPSLLNTETFIKHNGYEI